MIKKIKLKHLKKRLHKHLGHHIAHWARNTEYVGGMMELSFVVFLKIFLFAAIFSPEYGEHSLMAQKVDASLKQIGTGKVTHLQDFIKKEIQKTGHTLMKRELMELILQRIERQQILITYHTYISSFENTIKDMNIIELIGLQMKLSQGPLSIKAPMLYTLMQERIAYAQESLVRLPTPPKVTVANTGTTDTTILSVHASAPSISSSYTSQPELNDFVQMLGLELPNDQLDDE